MSLILIGDEDTCKGHHRADVDTLSQTSVVDCPLLDAFRMVHDPAIADKLPDFFAAILRACQDEKSTTPSLKEISPFLPLVIPILLRAISADSADPSAAIVLGYFIHHPILCHAIEAGDVFRQLMEITYRPNVSQQQRKMILWLLAEQRFPSVHVEPYIEQLIDAIVSLMQRENDIVERGQAVRALQQMHKQCPLHVTNSPNWVFPVFKLLLDGYTECSSLLALLADSDLQKAGARMEDIIALLRSRITVPGNDIILIEASRVAMQIVGPKLLKDNTVFSNLVHRLTATISRNDNPPSSLLASLSCWRQLIVCLGPRYCARTEKSLNHIRKLTIPLTITSKHGNTQVRLSTFRCYVALLNQIPDSTTFEESLWNLLVLPIIDFGFSGMDFEFRQLWLETLNDFLDTGELSGPTTPRKIIPRRLPHSLLFLFQDKEFDSGCYAHILKAGNNVLRSIMISRRISSGQELCDRGVASSNVYRDEWTDLLKLWEGLAYVAHNHTRLHELLQEQLSHILQFVSQLVQGPFEFPDISVVLPPTRYEDAIFCFSSLVPLLSIVFRAFGQNATTVFSTEFVKCSMCALFGIGKYFCIPPSDGSLNSSVLTDFKQAMKDFISFMDLCCTACSPMAVLDVLESGFDVRPAELNRSTKDCVGSAILYLIVWRILSLKSLGAPDIDMTAYIRLVLLPLRLPDSCWAYWDGSKDANDVFSFDGHQMEVRSDCVAERTLKNSELWDRLLGKLVDVPFGVCAEQSVKVLSVHNGEVHRLKVRLIVWLHSQTVSQLILPLLSTEVVFDAILSGTANESLKHWKLLRSIMASTILSLIKSEMSDSWIHADFQSILGCWTLLIDTLRDNLRNIQRSGKSSATCEALLWAIAIDIGVIFLECVEVHEARKANEVQRFMERFVDPLGAVLERVLVVANDIPVPTGFSTVRFNMSMSSEDISMPDVFSLLADSSHIRISLPTRGILNRIRADDDSARRSVPMDRDATKPKRKVSFAPSPPRAHVLDESTSHTGVAQLFKGSGLKNDDSILYVPVAAPESCTTLLTTSQKVKRKRETTLMTYTTIDHSQSMSFDASTQREYAVPSAEDLAHGSPKRSRPTSSVAETPPMTNEPEVKSNGETPMQPSNRTNWLSTLEALQTADLKSLTTEDLKRMQLLIAKLQLRILEECSFVSLGT